MDGWLLNLTRVSAVGVGLMAGLFFAFSAAVMPALERVDHPNGMRVMQSINSAIQNPGFGLVFAGSALASAALAVSSIWTWDQPGAGYRLAGGLVYLACGLVITVAYHIPRNNALDAVAPDDPAAPASWAACLREWVPMNHVRAAGSMASLVVLLLALGA